MHICAREWDSSETSLWLYYWFRETTSERLCFITTVYKTILVCLWNLPTSRMLLPKHNAKHSYKLIYRVFVAFRYFLMEWYQTHIKCMWGHQANANDFRSHLKTCIAFHYFSSEKLFCVIKAIHKIHWAYFLVHPILPYISHSWLNPGILTVSNNGFYIFWVPWPFAIFICVWLYVHACPSFDF